MLKKILVLDHDASVRHAALQYLKSPDRQVTAISGTGDPDALAHFHPADLVVFGSVDGVDPDRFSILRKAFEAPVIPLFRPSVVRGRQNGAARFGPELMLGFSDCRGRVGQHLQARAMPPGVAVRWGGFTLRLEPSAFAFQGEGLGLTRAQGAILSLLMLYGGEIVSCRLIEEVVFRGKPECRTNLIPVHISRLRKKLQDSRSDVFIENVRGIGYILFWHPSFSTDGIPEPELSLWERMGETAASSASARGSMCPRSAGPDLREQHQRWTYT